MLIPYHWSKSANEETLNRVVTNNLKSHATNLKILKRLTLNP